MDNLERIQEIDGILTTFLHQGFPITLLIVLLISISFVSESCYRKEMSRKGLLGYFIYLITTVVILFVITSWNQNYEEEREQLLEEFYSSLEETVTIETSDIVTSNPVKYRYCPHSDLYGSETTFCHLVEFVTDGEISQVLIPLEKSPYASVENKIKITYYDLSDKEREFIRNELGLDSGVGSVGRNVYPIYKNDWSLGISIEK